MNTIVVYSDEISEKLSNNCIEKFIYDSFTIVVVKNKHEDTAIIFDVATNKSWVSHRDNGRLWRDFAYICDFLKSEQETDEDSFKKISLERKNDDGQSCV